MNINETLVDVTEGDMCPIVLPPEVIIASTVISMFLILSGVLGKGCCIINNKENSISLHVFQVLLM